MRTVSYDLSLQTPLETMDGPSTTALGVQWDLLEAAQQWADTHGLEAVGGEPAALVLELWAQVLAGLESDPETLADRLDWVAKYRLLTAYRDRHQLDWSDPRLAAVALQYHDLRDHRSLAARAGLRQLTDPADVARAITEPPEDTRAYFRGRCLQKWGDSVTAANWDSIVFDVGEKSLRRVPMMEPLRGTRAHVGELLEQSADPADLLARLGAAG